MYIYIVYIKRELLEFNNTPYCPTNPIVLPKLGDEDEHKRRNCACTSTYCPPKLGGRGRSPEGVCKTPNSPFSQIVYNLQSY